LPAEALEDMAEFIVENLKGSVLGSHFERDELVITAKSESIEKTLQFLRDNPECGFRVLIDICASDYPDRPDRFEIIYNLLSLRQNDRVRVKISVEEDQIVPSVVKLYSAACWFEREVWDMYGIPFSGNPDLRRILTDYGFEGHPQRKDFPLTGYVELRYDNEYKRVAYEPVQLTQDFRRFDFVSPWESVTDVQLPGDEKAAIPPHGWSSMADSVSEAGRGSAENDNRDEMPVDAQEEDTKNAS